jgi:ParG
VRGPRKSHNRDRLGLRWRPLAVATYNRISSSLDREEVSPIVTVAGQQVKRMNLNVPIELHNAFKAATAARGQNMTDELLKFIENYVAKHAPKQPEGRRK